MANVSISSRRRQWTVALAAVAVSAVVGAVTHVPKHHPLLTFHAEALFSDETPQNVAPAEPALNQSFRVRLRTGMDEVKSAYVVNSQTGVQVPMQKVSSDDVWFDYYAASLPGSKDPVQYYFKVIPYQGRVSYVALDGVSSDAPDSASSFEVIPGFQTPSWAVGTVFYQIFPDRFYNGDKSNDVVTGEFNYQGGQSVKVSNWSAPPSGYAGSTDNRTREFYGGDLQGIIDKLDYLKSLGIGALYLNPIFVSPSNHKYDTQDYNHVDPHLGVIVHDGGDLATPTGTDDNSQSTKYIERTEDPANLAASDALLATLIEKAHELGIRVILDGVFNHSGDFNKWFDAAHIYPNTAPEGPGAFESALSPYHQYYMFNSKNWPNNTDYDAWNQYSTLPKLNYQNSPALVQKIYSIAEKWVSPPYSADGWRLDSAGDLGYGQDYNIHFWDGFRGAVKSANPSALILAEYYEDPGLYLDGKGWDSVQNSNGFLTPLSLFLTGLDVHSDKPQPNLKGDVSSFLATMQDEVEQFTYPSLYTAMNAIDNHDVSRFLTRTNGMVGSYDAGLTPADASKGVNTSTLEQAVAVDMTWPGSPTVYYGDEAGQVGFTDPDDRRTFPWGHENQQVESFYHNLIGIHNKYSCFKTGSMLTFSSRSLPHLLEYGRFDGASAGVTLINAGTHDETVTVPAWRLGTSDGTNWQVYEGGKLQDGVIVQHGKSVIVPVKAGQYVILATQR